MPKFYGIAALILAASTSVAFANTAKKIEMPTQQNKWQVSVAGLYVQPSFGGNGLGYSSFSNYGYDYAGNLVEVNGATNNLSNMQPNREWAFQLEGAYGFGSGNDVDLNWYHLDNNTSGMLPRGTLFAGSAPSLYAGAIKVNTNWDALNIEIGQLFNFSETKLLRLHVGLQGADIGVKFTNYPRLLSAGPNAVFVTKENITYRGIGPRAGGAFTWLPGKGFGIYAKGAAALLVGTAKQSVSGYTNLGGFNLYSTGNYNQSNHSVVVPGFEGKLGVKYDYPIRNAVLGVDVGYLWVAYVNALVSQVGSGVVSSAISNNSSANFDVNGLALTLTLSGNV